MIIFYHAIFSNYEDARAKELNERKNEWLKLQQQNALIAITRQASKNYTRRCTTFSSHKCMLNYLLSPCQITMEKKNWWRREQNTHTNNQQTAAQWTKWNLWLAWLIKLVDSPINVRVCAISIYPKEKWTQEFSARLRQTNTFKIVFRWCEFKSQRTNNVEIWIIKQYLYTIHDVCAVLLIHIYFAVIIMIWSHVRKHAHSKLEHFPNTQIATGVCNE